ncbi:GNAT family N-acetyltransferase [Flexithrix dorotheae]|uniref:GNAT family N-acetyltransferase n=1 Tax=Flexithrix dorotheae TaxID=70993 RepID=UPI0003695607|nr:GNAT family N-acetyltransferase [Flexithrix dorotheae]
MPVKICTNKIPEQEKIIQIYRLNKWSSAEKPEILFNALKNSDSLVTAWDEDLLIGIGNAITDGFLVVYYPHLLVHPEYQGKGIGKMIMEVLQEKYKEFHQQMLVSDGNAVEFYKKCGFEKAGETVPMWIYQGDDH